MRFPSISSGEMSPRQAQVEQEIVRGPRGTIGGPLSVLLHNPELASCLEKLGVFLRFQSTMPASLRELAILTITRSWNCEFEWLAHERLVLEKQLLHPDLVAAIGAGDKLPLPTNAQKVVHEFCSAALKEHKIPERLADDLVSTLGREATLDLAALVGYFSTLAMVLELAGVEGQHRAQKKELQTPQSGNFNHA